MTDVAAQIRLMGRALGPDVLAQSQSLYAAAQHVLATPSHRIVEDCAYGEHPRHRLDVYRSERGSGAPIVVWVHGGGFLRGEKRAADHPFSAHMGEFLARHEYVGIVINYRLAPECRWPCGGEDLHRVLEWLDQHPHVHGGDLNRIVLAGTSAGAAHIGTAFQIAPMPSTVRGAVLMSGLYGVTEPESRDLLYYPDGDRSAYRSTSALARSGKPLLITCAEYDPVRFQQEALGLATAVLHERQLLPSFSRIEGHNHYTAALHIGCGDERFCRQMLDFMAGACTDER
jgi:arylformamidase